MLTTILAFSLVSSSTLPMKAGTHIIGKASVVLSPTTSRPLLSQSRTCGLAVNDGSNGASLSWATPGNAEGVADGFLTSVTCSNTITKWLWCTNYGFSLPSNAIVDKVEVLITGDEGDAPRYDFAGLNPVKIQLVSGGATLGVTQNWGSYLLPPYLISPPVSWNYDYTLWGNSSIGFGTINASSFGVAFYLDYDFGGGSGSPDPTKVDEVQITVTYHT